MPGGSDPALADSLPLALCLQDTPYSPTIHAWQAMADEYPKAGVRRCCCWAGGFQGVDPAHHPTAAGGILCSGSAPSAPHLAMNVACISGTRSQPRPIPAVIAVLRSIGSRNDVPTILSARVGFLVSAPDSQPHFLLLKMPMNLYVHVSVFSFWKRGYCIRGSPYQPKDCGLEWHQISCRARRGKRLPSSTVHCFPI